MKTLEELKNWLEEERPNMSEQVYARAKEFIENTIDPKMPPSTIYLDEDKVVCMEFLSSSGSDRARVLINIGKDDKGSGGCMVGIWHSYDAMVENLPGALEYLNS